MRYWQELLYTLQDILFVGILIQDLRVQCLVVRDNARVQQLYQIANAAAASVINGGTNSLVQAQEGKKWL